MTSQVAVKLPPEMVAAVDGLVRAGRFDSRSHAIRAGIDLVVRGARADLIDDSFRRGFQACPESTGELADARRLATEAIEAEPWEKWW